MAEQGKKRNKALPARARAKAKSRALLLFYGLVFIGVVVGAVLLCIFVFFKVSKVDIKGASLYSSEQLMESAGIASGDNLVFLDTKALEQALFEQFPYIEAVKVKKKLPSTVEISVIEATAAYSVEHGGGYVYVSKQGKILEVAASPREGSIVVKAGEVGDNNGYLSLATQELQDVFAEILAIFAGREAGGVTQIDLTDIHNLSIIYDGRITMKLGSAADLTFKITYGLKASDDEIAPDERGVLDLSHVKESNKAYYSLEVLATPEPEAGGEGDNGESADEGENAESGAEGGEDGPENNGGEPEDASSRESTRGDDIPDV